MNVVFLHVGKDTTIPELMLESVRKTQFGEQIIQLTDETTPQLVGNAFDKCIRIPWDGRRLMEYKTRHLAALPDQDLLWLDTDVIVQQDLSPVFGFPFDVAVTRRNNVVLDAVGTDAGKMMPFNTGVVFTRKQRFWQECHRFVLAQEKCIQDWYGDQFAVREMSRYFHRLILDCENFNYTPESEDEDVSLRYAVHYKGHRKDWMRKRNRQVDTTLT